MMFSFGGLVRTEARIRNSNVLLGMPGFGKFRVLRGVNDVSIGHVVIARATKRLDGSVLLGRERAEGRRLSPPTCLVPCSTLVY